MRHSTRSAIAALGIAACTVTGAMVATASAQATGTPVTTIVVAPVGNDVAAGDASHPVATLARAQELARTAASQSDVVVDLAGGTYRPSAPLEFTSADSGRNGHTVTWQAMPGQTPLVSGAQPVTGWTLHDSAANIWAAAVPTGIDSRQLYVDGALAPRAAMPISRGDVTITTSGMTITNSALNFLATLPEQNRIEVESQDSFTDRYAPVQSINGATVTMQQPAWNNNNWGYDTLAHPFAGGQLQLENSLAFVKNAGQWYLDPQAGQLYYKAAVGQSPVGHDVELPTMTSLVHINGSLANPVTNISMRGMTFEYTTWLQPGTSIGYADEQNGAFIGEAWQQPSDFLTSCQSGCTLFEAARNSWRQVPAAVQVSAANGVTFANDTFTHLGQVGLGIGNDADANASGIGLGASNVTVDHNVFTDDSGAGVVVGGVQPDAHHPSNPAMTNQNITITNNLVTKVAEDYKEMSGILSTYVTHAVISHNEVSNLGYDGIDVGWGWGANDPGGSQDYRNRGLYNFQPVYTTPTTLKNTVISFNLVHGTKKVFHDGGSIYNLSLNPGSSIDHNYVFDNQHTVGLYLDEGSRSLSLTNNVIQDTGVWAFTNANPNNNTNDSTFANNWLNGGATQVATGPPHNNVLSNNVQVSGTNWPSGAQQVIQQVGVTPSGGTTGGAVHAVGAARCLDVPGSSTTPGTQLQIWDCNGGPNQIWTRTSANQLTVYSGSNQMCLDAFNNQTTPGTKVEIWTCTGGANQQWTVNANGTVTGTQSGLCLDVTGAGTANGTLVELWTCNGGSNQQWTLG
ncbi:MAG TPA: ricin-type beta-trefoil lectin domain protein [Pseudonocardiaceae bacterium]|nr:ricin-type beta-trefoil lectin domain protein [Pseudonocardiaceae bacterium]